MGFRFKKSKQIAPGVRVNFNKKSTSVTFGGKGVHHTINSNGKKTTSAGIPGSGLYYTSSSGGGGGSRNVNEHTVSSASGGGNNSSFIPDPKGDRDGNKKGCGTYLIYVAIALIVFIVSELLTFFASIIAIPIFIYFWKHKEKAHRKSFLAFAVFAFIVGLGYSIVFDIDTISVKSNKNIVMDINSSKKISYSIDPEGANTDELKLVSSGSGILVTKLDKDNSKFTIKSKAKTGTTTVYLKDNNADVTSKKIKVTVEDKKAIAEAKKKAEQEKKRKAEEAKKKEQARIAAEKKKAEEAQQTTEQATTTEREEMVWVSNTGSKYHSNPNCSNMRNPIKETLSDAKSRGLSPCSKCY
jgi:hypothetical protein